MDLFRPNIASTSGTSHGSEESSAPPSIILFREIHKNAWLRKLPSIDRRAGAVPRKGERVWTVFCVHDDVQPFLELYTDQKMAVAHKPDWCVSLSSTLHVSPTIVPHDQEYEFVITLPSDIVRLTAPSWDTMMEWVDTIRSKLRELRILCPRENVYSRMPEPRLPLLPTRDPNSPLPPPPLGPSALVPGVEPVHLEGAEQVTLSVAPPPLSSGSLTPVDAAAGGSGVTPPGNVISNPPDSRSRQRVRSSSLSENPSVDSTSPSVQSPARGSSSSRSPVSRCSRQATPSRPLVPLVTPVSNTLGSNVSQSSAFAQVSPLPSIPSSSRSVQSPVSRVTSSAGSDDFGHGGSGNQNVTIIEVADSRRTPCDIFNFNFVREALPQSEVLEEPREQFFTPPGTPRSHASISQAPISDPVQSVSPPPSRIWQQITQVVSSLMGQTPNPISSPPQSEVIRVAQGITNITIPSHELNNDAPSNSSVYEHVYPMTNNEANSTVPEEGRHRVLQQSASHQARPAVTETHHRRRRTSSGSEILSPRSQQTANSPRQQPAPELERRLHPTPHSFRQGTLGLEVVGGGSARVTLRDQQVQQLRKEMLHPGGVRLQVRRKDCTNSIAFIDAFGAVWVAGWKQREHPMLYNALHIGDQLLSAAGFTVQSAADAHRFIRGSTSLYVPFVIRRVPFGRVFAFRRETEGQSLGITLEGGTAEIRDVAPHSPAARGGLAPRAPSCDGLSLTSWVITEINGRPLNLFFKDSEVRDRLNAVGKEISVLVQPFDLIKHIKKQLKTIRGYKDYIVQ